MDIEIDSTVAARQRNVHRKLGRFLVRIQQYERLLKGLVIDAEHAGTVDTIRSFREERTKRLSNKSLGIMIDELKASYLKVTPGPSADEPDEGPDRVAIERPFIRLKMGMEMSTTDLARTTEDLAKLVDLRNRLVHHLIEDFDIWTLDGCNAALEHLDTSFETVDTMFSELKQWTETSRHAMALHAAFMQSSEFLELVYYGVMPDGTVKWEGSPVVAVLQRIETEAAEEGWVNLEAAIATIRAKYSDHTPQRYRCKNWRQVLSRSQQFELRREAAREGVPGRTWYRSRAAG